jgi:hypothetical protein
VEGNPDEDGCGSRQVGKEGCIQSSSQWRRNDDEKMRELWESRRRGRNGNGDELLLVGGGTGAVLGVGRGVPGGYWRRAVQGMVGFGLLRERKRTVMLALGRETGVGWGEGGSGYEKVYVAEADWWWCSPLGGNEVVPEWGGGGTRGVLGGSGTGRV